VIQKVYLTDSIPVNFGIERPKDIMDRKIEQLSVAPLLAQAIKAIYDNESVSSLFV
jgi:phosphoribosylpyrophosphate synthetase